MEGASASGDIQDWELLPSSEPLLANSADTTNEFSSVGGESEGVIRYNDYFSIDNSIKYRTANEKVTDWLDDKKNLNCGGFLSDSGSDVSRNREFDGINEADIIVNCKSEVVLEGISEPIDFQSKSRVVEGENVKEPVFEGTSEARSLIGLGSGSSRNLSVKGEFGVVKMKVKTGDTLMEGNGDIGVVNESGAGNGLNGKEIGVKSPKEVEGGKKMVVWWKLPLELLKYCVSRASPVWSLSMAAAFLGLIILGRRLQRMKQKSRSLQIKVTMDDKNVSQFMSRAARLNEAFTVVRRVPMVRPPSLPVAGITPWPAMNLR